MGNITRQHISAKRKYQMRCVCVWSEENSCDNGHSSSESSDRVEGFLDVPLSYYLNLTDTHIFAKNIIQPSPITDAPTTAAPTTAAPTTGSPTTVSSSVDD